MTKETMTKETTKTYTNESIRTDADARACIEQIAKANPSLLERDLDALFEIGEVDNETVFDGYLWEAVEDAVPEMEEDTNDLLSSAIVDFFFDQMDIEEEEEDIEETRLVLTKEEVQALRYTLDDIADVYADLGEDDLIDEDMGIEQIHRMADVLRGILGRLPKED